MNTFLVVCRQCTRDILICVQWMSGQFTLEPSTAVVHCANLTPLCMQPLVLCTVPVAVCTVAVKVYIHGTYLFVFHFQTFAPWML